MPRRFTGGDWQNTCNSMRGETLNVPPPSTGRLPHHLLFSISARIGGAGLDTDAFEALRASHRGGFLEKAIAYDNRQSEVPNIRSLRWHPIRLLSSLPRAQYYGAKKKYLGWIAARELATGRYDLFHSWSGDCLEALRVARAKRIPSLIEIPTWHRDFGQMKNIATTQARNWRERMLLTHDRFLEEYQLADVIVVLSQKAAESFRARGFAEEKLYYLPRGVDVERFKPGKRPEKFRVIFSGALIERKGIHHLLEAWHRLDLPNAELWLVGSVHEEAKPHLQKYWRDNIRTIGFAQRPEDFLSQGTIHVFPSQLEGSAKTTYEASACGLPQVITRESGDVVRDREEGLIISPGDVGAIAEAIRYFFDNPSEVERMGTNARQRVVENFTWDHYRTRLLDAYSHALEVAS